MAEVEFTNAELMDMVILYGEARQNAAAAARLYAERFPNRVAPTPRRLLAVIQRGRETANLQPQRGIGGGRERLLRVLEVEDDILEMIENNPQLSTREIARHLPVSHWTVWRALHEQQMHPYHVQRVQALVATDFPRRREFCGWFLRQHQQQPDFSEYVFSTDECCFTRNGVLNFRNTHVWSIENPHVIRRTNFQQRFSVNLWAGIVGNQLIGPHELPPRVNGASYLAFLQEQLPPLLENVPLNVRQDMWFLHDGAPPHFSVEVRNHLNEVFPGRWIGRGGVVEWPPRSPDLTPLDFFLWGYLKSRVYVSEVTTIEDLRQRIEVAVTDFRHHQHEILPMVMRNWRRRAQLCTEVNGHHFEHML